MQKKVLTILFLMATTYVVGQTPTKKPNFVVLPTTLKINRSGIPIYCSTLRYNDTTVLDIVVIPRQVGLHFFKSPDPKYDDYDFEYGIRSFRFSSDLLKPNQVLELVSKYKFKLENNELSRSFTNSTERNAMVGMTTDTNALPDYLKLTLEEVKLK